MWENSELKQRAKAVLKRFGFWLPFAVTLVAGILASDIGELFSVITENPEIAKLYENEYIGPVLSAVLPSLALVSLVWGIFVGDPIVVGQNRFFMEHRISGSKLEKIFFVFKSGNYFNVVKTMFLMSIKIILWSFLFIIPGIIKTYQYSMVPYILAENPGIEPKRALELSKEMTSGEKFNIFLLELSFFGWYLLSVITCGIGIFFVMPYLNATFAELYQVMREKAHSQNLSDFSELPGFFPEQE